MTTSIYLKQSTDLLRTHGIASARLDSLILLEFVLEIDRAKILAEPDLLITLKQKNVLDQLIAKRSSHVPIAQLTNKTEFYGRSFYINESVLEPRPESETMIDMLVSLVKSSEYHNRILASHRDQSKGTIVTKTIKIADLGTGSGALGITAKLELQNSLVDLIDIDERALKVAKRNVALHTIGINVIQNDLLEAQDKEYDILLCNLPYVPDDFKINLAAGHEPRIAIFGGSDGLDVYRRLFNRLQKIHHRPLYILTEALPLSHSNLEAIANESNYILEATDDFVQLFIDASTA